VQDKAYYATLLIIAGCSIAIAYRILNTPEPEWPTVEQMLEAIENGAGNLTVTPLTQSDN
jgi:hypothetical protein